MKAPDPAVAADARIGEAAAALYAACGQPPPTVAVMGDEPAYLGALEAFAPPMAAWGVAAIPAGVGLAGAAFAWAAALALAAGGGFPAALAAWAALGGGLLTGGVALPLALASGADARTAKESLLPGSSAAVARTPAGILAALAPGVPPAAPAKGRSLWRFRKPDVRDAGGGDFRVGWGERARGVRAACLRLGRANVFDQGMPPGILPDDIAAAAAAVDGRLSSTREPGASDDAVALATDLDGLVDEIFLMDGFAVALATVRPRTASGTRAGSRTVRSLPPPGNGSVAVARGLPGGIPLAHERDCGGHAPGQVFLPREER